jgi:hypothetical protein
MSRPARRLKNTSSIISPRVSRHGGRVGVGLEVAVLVGPAVAPNGVSVIVGKMTSCTVETGVAVGVNSVAGRVAVGGDVG